MKLCRSVALDRSKIVVLLPLLAADIPGLTGRNQNNLGVGAAVIDNVDPESLSWETRAEFPGGGRHHPITFANATHGFVLTGSTLRETFTSDFWAYEAETDDWIDLSGTDAAFPGTPRSFGYGVASVSDCGNSKAYLGFGAAENPQRLADWWEFDMFTHDWRRLADFPGEARRHPAVNFVEPKGEIHVGLGDGYYGNYNDYWSYDIAADEWRQLEDFPSTERHHPFYFAIGADSYVGLGHSTGYNPWIERDWYRYDAIDGTWNREQDFASYDLGTLGGNPGTTMEDVFPMTTEARVAGTQFSVASSCASDEKLGFVLSGDGDDHSTMETGEFHVFDPSDDSIWHALPPHPGFSRWAPGSFVLQGTTRAYFFGGYDRQQGILYSDLWEIDLEPLFLEGGSPVLNEGSIVSTDNASSPTSNGASELLFTNGNSDVSIKNPSTSNDSTELPLVNEESTTPTSNASPSASNDANESLLTNEKSTMPTSNASPSAFNADDENFMNENSSLQTDNASPSVFNVKHVWQYSLSISAVMLTVAFTL